MGILKGFMILGTICFMFLAFCETCNKDHFTRDLIAMAACSAIAMYIEILF